MKCSCTLTVIYYVQRLFLLQENFMKLHFGFKFRPNLFSHFLHVRLPFTVVKYLNCCRFFHLPYTNPCTVFALVGILVILVNNIKELRFLNNVLIYCVTLGNGKSFPKYAPQHKLQIIHIYSIGAFSKQINIFCF